MTDLHLSPDEIDRLAEAVAIRVAEYLRTDDSNAPLIDAAEVARRHGVTRSWAYDNAGRLGAVRLGNGSRPRIRFNPATVAAALASRIEPSSPTLRAPRQRVDRTPAGAPLLAVKGQTA